MRLLLVDSSSLFRGSTPKGGYIDSYQNIVDRLETILAILMFERILCYNVLVNQLNLTNVIADTRRCRLRKS